MSLPDLNEVRYAVSSIIKNLESLINMISSQESLTYGEYRSYLHSIMMELVQIWGEIDFLTIADRKYEKGFEKIRKMLLLLNDIHRTEMKHEKNRFIFLTTQVSKTMRKDLIKFLKSISKRMKQVQKIVR
jgi:hypothetical protein